MNSKQTPSFETFPRAHASFEKLRMLGQGSFGKVFLCRLRQNGDEFALKIVPLCEEKDKQLVEAETSCSLLHPNIVKALTFWSETAATTRYLFIQMEYISGGSLRRAIVERVFAKSGKAGDDVWSVIRNILHGLAFIHAKGYIHRDIKPENILLSNGLAKIADFGLATRDKRSKQSICLATERYMAPEFLTEDYTALVDIYSFGITVFEMFLSIHLEERDKPNQLDILTFQFAKNTLQYPEIFQEHPAQQALISLMVAQKATKRLPAIALLRDRRFPHLRGFPMKTH